MANHETTTRKIFDDVFNAARIDRMADLAHDDIVIHYGGSDVRGVDAYREGWTESHDAFPDEHFTIEELIVAGDDVITRWSWSATNQGGYLGAAPDGRRVMTTGISVYRFRDDRVAEAWVEMDELGLARQLGVLSA